MVKENRLSPQESSFKRSILFSCPSCRHQQKMFLREQESVVHCQKCFYEKEFATESLFEECLFCSCRAFFVQKNVRPLFMFAFLAVAIIFVPQTYGLSLAVLWVLDLVLSGFIGDIVVCYRCRSSFFGFHFPSRFKAFQHHIGERYEEKKKGGS